MGIVVLKDEFAEVKAGDKIIVTGKFSAPDTIEVVERVTPKFVVVNGVKYHKSDGRRSGGDIWTSGIHLKHATEEAVAKIEEQKLRNNIIYFLQNKCDYTQLPTQTLRILYMLLNPKVANKDKQVPKWLYRLEFKDDSCGLWYNGKGKWCFEEGIGSLGDECKTKTLPMDYDPRYKQDGRDWFSSCSKKEDLTHWYSLEDAKKLLANGFVFTRYLATEYHEYDLQTVFIKDTALKREEIDIFELFKETEECQK